MSSTKFTPNCLFEVSWEVCNKVGGIHTVVSTKALTATKQFGDKYILVGPDISKEGGNSEFEEDANLLSLWRKSLYSDGIRVRVGRWKTEGSPIVVLVDFTYLFPKKDEVLKSLWDSYQVDSISGQWDYVESILFGYAAGVVIASYVDQCCSKTDKIAAHFHEWMTVSGALYLRKYSPYVATLFTTHATVMGRCIAGNGLPLYNNLNNYNSDEMARQFNVTAKHSIEKIAAESVDAFVTVSDITAAECKALIGRQVDCVTPNGFENDFVWKGKEYTSRSKEARGMMISTAEAIYGVKYKSEPLIIGTSGRYEFRNKGVDLLLESLKELANNPNLNREVLAYIMIPSGNFGANKELQKRLESGVVEGALGSISTHYLENPQWDQVSNAVKESALVSPDSKVKVVFVPSYLDGQDGIFNRNYYELLVGMDLTVFPSYYEPWGYTPLESAAFSVPTLTTSLAGFGAWVSQMHKHDGVMVIRRDDYNDSSVIYELSSAIERFVNSSAARVKQIRTSAAEIANTALWENLFASYQEAYSVAIENSIERTHRVILNDDAYSGDSLNSEMPGIESEQPNWHRMIIERHLPERLVALEAISRNLWWCWNSDARELFEYIDSELWEKIDRNPITLLDSLSLSRVSELEKDAKFLSMLDAVYAKFNAYMSEKPTADKSTVAYFSMEYGLHASLKIYSGGLGILAGDYLKEASDRNVPMVAVGLLYRYGYFTQQLSAQGGQEATYEAQNFSKLPISPVRDEEGNWVSVQINFPGRQLTAHVWRCDVGRVPLYLLDTDYEANLPEDRQITYHLYGGDWENRLKQEILLGIGGIRLLNKLGVEQQVYHCNEGHAAFIGVERMRNLVKNHGLRYSEALEVVRSSALFTTHTPVPAGHDAFVEPMIRQYMSHYPAELGISWETYIALGKNNVYDPNDKFSMSNLACSLSQEVNGVSWLHGEVSKDILGYLWPGYLKDELHIGYVTNGVHYPTWVSATLRRLYEKYLSPDYAAQTYNIESWQGVNNIPDSDLWSARMFLKNRLIDYIKTRYSDVKKVLVDSPSQIVRVKESLDPNVLTIGFARRFATYKRAHLLFTNLERLERLVNNPERPVQFVFAGKAHPNDKPGQDLIKRIVEVSHMPQFVGKIIFLQNYDMEIARRMVQGVDVWLNTPTRPLEASGTSGEKCVMNGVLQFSVLDGWWVEGYKESAGWMLPMERSFADQGAQNELDAELIYTTIEESIAPLYYENRDANNVPMGWIKYVKSCIADVASNFTMNRMIIDYEDRFYNQLAERNDAIREDDFKMARDLAAWKSEVSAEWSKVKVIDVKRVKMDDSPVLVGIPYHTEVTLNTAQLSCDDIGVEVVIANQVEHGQNANLVERIDMQLSDAKGSIAVYSLDYLPVNAGSYDIAIRIYPKSAKLAHRMDFAIMKWV
ncbi:MAG: alpha-glucan family phosphorylase [Rikenellaceae bacterium]